MIKLPSLGDPLNVLILESGGARGSALRYKPEGRGFDSPMVLLEFFIDIILPAALWTCG